MIIGWCTMLQKIDYELLGHKIKQLRTSAGITQESLAEMVSCNTSHISNIENNYTKVSLNVLLAIANSLNTSIDFLLSNQYVSETTALDNEITRQITQLSVDKKKQILRIIKAL